VKWLLALLVCVAGGVAAAALAVPSNAATVNGVAISQSAFNSSLSDIANGTGNLYECYLNAEEYVNSQGTATLPSVAGAGEPAPDGTRTSASTAFATSELDNEIYQLLLTQLAARRHVEVTAAALGDARATLEADITSLMGEVASTPYACGATGVSITGATVLGSMPKSFVDGQVLAEAQLAVLQEQLSGVGSSTADLESYFNAHSALFQSACFTVAQYSSLSDAQAAVYEVGHGASFATLATSTGGGPQGCEDLDAVASELPQANLENLALNTLSAPISVQGSYLLVEITAKTPLPFETAEPDVEQAVRAKGATAFNKAISDAEHGAHIWVDPRYGSWTAAELRVLVPTAPAAADVLDPAVNSAAGTATSEKSG